MQCSTVQGLAVQFSAVQFTAVQCKVVQCRLRPNILKQSIIVQWSASASGMIQQQTEVQFMWKNSSLLSCTAKHCTVMHCTRYSWTWCTTRYCSPNSNITKLVYLYLECAKVWFCVFRSLWFIYSIYIDISTTYAVQFNAVQCSAA